MLRHFDRAESDDPDLTEDEIHASVMGTAVKIVALSALLIGVWQHWNRSHQLRGGGRSAAKPEPLNTWEAEGGQSQMVAESAPLAATTHD